MFNAKLVDAVEAATRALGYSHRRITSGAGHDACNLRECGAGSDDLRALQGWRQPQRIGGRNPGRLHRRRQRPDAYRARARRRRVLAANKPTDYGGQFARSVCRCQ